MATVGVVDVKDLTLFLDINKTGTFVAVACATDASIDFNQALRRIECKDTAGGVDFAPSTKEWTVSLSGLYAIDSALGGIQLVDALLASQKIAVKYATAESGDAYYTGDVYPTNINLSSSGGSGENATYSGSFQGLGIPTKAINA